MRMIGRGEFPVANSADRLAPRRPARRRRSHPAQLRGRGAVREPERAVSCFHRFGVMGDLVGRSLVEVTTDLVEHQSPVDESMPLVVMGRAPVADRPRGARRVPVAARRAADRARPAHRRRAAVPRRVRAAPPGARAHHQGRDDPRDPPPREEQPADGRRAAAAAGPADDVAGGQGGARGGDAPGGHDRARARDALADPRRGGPVRRPHGPQPAARGRRRLGGCARAHAERAARSGWSRPRTRPRSRSSSPSS